MQFFVNDAADPSGYGEGQTLLGTRTLKTDASGNASFTFTFSSGVAAGQIITSTATDPQNNTSEFSAGYQLASGVVTGNQPPVAEPGGPYTINEGSSLQLDGSHSSDPDGDPLTYTWDINGDGVFGDATGAKPTLTWAQLNALGIVNGPSSFNVSLRVDDGQGHVVTSTTTLSVLNVAPTANAGPDLEVNEEDTVSLTGAFTDPGQLDTQTLAWSVIADNGQVIPGGSGTTFSFVPDDNGNYAVTFTVTDSDGGIGKDVVNVQVDNVAPNATINGAPAQGTVGVPINLTSTVTDISPVDTAAGFNYQWEAFDPIEFEVVGQSSDFSFTPPEPGLYTVEFFPSDKDGGSGFASVNINVVSTTGTIPTVAISDAGGTFSGSPFPATATVAGTDNNPVGSLEGVSPTVTYYSGSTPTGTPLTGVPVAPALTQPSRTSLAAPTTPPPTAIPSRSLSIRPPRRLPSAMQAAHSPVQLIQRRPKLPASITLPSPAWKASARR